ncbi:MAG: hypothetical protein QF451_10290 [Nitrospinota bacterium]|nr:hypothetical protein [Nitrospinota bacterium]
MGTINLMWELAIVTDEVDDDLEVALRYAKEWGMRRVEFRTLFGKGAWNLAAFEQNEALAMVRGEGFEVAGIGSQFLRISSMMPVKGSSLGRERGWLRW